MREVEFLSESDIYFFPVSLINKFDKIKYYSSRWYWVTIILFPANKQKGNLL